MVFFDSLYIYNGAASLPSLLYVVLTFHSLDQSSRAVWLKHMDGEASGG